MGITTVNRSSFFTLASCSPIIFPYISAVLIPCGCGCFGPVSCDACSSRELSTRFLCASTSSCVRGGVLGVGSPVRFFFTAFLRCIECAERPDISLEEESRSEENRWDVVVVLWDMWPLRKDHVSRISSSRAVLSLASEPLHFKCLDLPKCCPLLFEVLSALKEGRCRGEEACTLLPQIELGKIKKKRNFRNTSTYKFKMVLTHFRSHTHTLLIFHS